MYKTVFISSLTLALVGCVNQQAQTPPVQVQDLSSARAAEVPAQYTVVAGDTLYGIAWRHNMDFRELARLNNISPPYRIDVGQSLALAPSAQAGGVAQVAANQGASSQTGAVATPLGGAAAAAGGAAAAGAAGSSEDLEWLLPNGETETVSATNGTQVQAQAAESAAQVADPSTPGPVYDYDSPGAEGDLSAADVAERERLQAQEEVAAAAEREAQERAESSDAAQSNAGSGETAVAGETSATAAASSASQEPSGGAARTYTPVAEVPWQWPTNGQVVGNFGEGSSITAGIDIGGQKGQPVKAAGPGIVVYAGSGVRGYGKLILLKHNDQYLSAYAHNDSLKVQENDVVEAGQQIATMGDTDAEDVRLHFEVRKDGQPQDPTKYLPSR